MRVASLYFYEPKPSADMTNARSSVSVEISSGPAAIGAKDHAISLWIDSLASKGLFFSLSF